MVNRYEYIVSIHIIKQKEEVLAAKIKKMKFTLDKSQEDVLLYYIPLTDEWDIGLSIKMNEERGCKQRKCVGLAGTARKTGITALKRNNRGCTLTGLQEATFSPYHLAQKSQLKNKRGGRGHASHISNISYSTTFINPIVCKP